MNDLILCLKDIDAKAVLYLDDVTRLTGITARNIKFWVQEYNLKTIKQGRKNQYPRKTVALLILIHLMSESRFFTKRYQQILVKQCLGASKSKIRDLKEYERLMYNVDQVHCYLGGLSASELENITDKIELEQEGISDKVAVDLSDDEEGALLAESYEDTVAVVAEPHVDEDVRAESMLPGGDKLPLTARVPIRKVEEPFKLPTGILERPQAERRGFLSGILSKFKR